MVKKQITKKYKQLKPYMRKIVGQKGKALSRGERVLITKEANKKEVQTSRAYLSKIQKRNKQTNKTC